MTETDNLLKKYLEDLAYDLGNETVINRLLKEGKCYASQDLTSEEKKTIRKRINSINMPFTKDSFKNSSMMSTSDSRERVKYIEGFAYINGYNIAFPHAWNELNGKVIDTTLKDENDNNNIGIFKKVAYLGIVFTTSEIRILLGKSALFPFLNTQ